MSGESRAARPRSRHASHWVVAIAVLCAFAACVRRVPPLRVCADPNNLPFSNDRGEGFENRIAELLAADRHARVEYTWWAQRRGFVRNTLSAGACDLMIGVPSGADIALTTRPYYRSTYVFVSRADRGLALGSFDDSRLRRLRIGVQMIGDDFANTPPAHALAARGMVQNIVGYSVYGDYSQPHPLSGIIDAVASHAEPAGPEVLRRPGATAAVGLAHRLVEAESMRLCTAPDDQGVSDEWLEQAGLLDLVEDWRSSGEDLLAAAS